MERLAETVPAPTVREAMTFGGFASATLVAGATGLSRPIEWVRIMETPDTARRMRPNELLLTTAFPIKDDPEAQLNLVDTIANSGGSGLVVKLGLYVDELPRGMAEEAERVSLPLFTLSHDVQWSDLMEPLLERIINAEHSRLKRSIEIHQRFTELVLDGKGVTEITRTLAELLDSAVSVEDASFHLLAHAGGATDQHRRETIARHGTPPRVLYDPQIQSMLRALQTEYRVAKAREDNLLTNVNQLKREGQELNEKEIQYLTLQRDLEGNQQLYETVLKRLKETGMAGGLETNNIRIMEDAAAPSTPVRPQKSRNITLAAMIGLLLGVGFAVAIEYFDTTVKSTDDVDRYLGLPVIAIVPAFSVKR